MRFVIICGIIVLSLSNLFAQRGIPERPEPPRLVNDFAGILSVQEQNYLESKLVSFSDSTGTQIAIVVVKGLEGYDRAEFTYTLLNKWGVGQAGKDNGVVIMIKPKVGQEQGVAFIAQGKGLEGVMPDITAKRIIENEMIPHFKNNDYFQGLNNAADIIMGLANQEFSAAEYDKKSKAIPAISIVPLIIFIVIFLLLVKAKSRNSSLGHDTSIWTLLMLLSATNRSHSGSFGDFTNNRGGGGFGGGGFGGFGGGSSGGGGAGGSW